MKITSLVHVPMYILLTRSFRCFFIPFVILVSVVALVARDVLLVVVLVDLSAAAAAAVGPSHQAIGDQ